MNEMSVKKEQILTRSNRFGIRTFLFFILVNHIGPRGRGRRGLCVAHFVVIVGVESSNDGSIR